MPEINLSYVNAVPVLLPEWKTLNIVLVGCGGNGSIMSEAIARLAYALIKGGKDVKLHFVDPDQVEEKNVLRQQFYPYEVGFNKAHCLALRHGTRLGLRVEAYDQLFKPNLINSLRAYQSLTLMVGCLDNQESGVAGRLEIAQLLRENSPNQLPQFWWLEMGNDFSSGQVVMGSSADNEQMAMALQSPSHCLCLPSPDWVHPDLLDAAIMAEVGLGCADIALIQEQSRVVNQTTTAIAINYLNQWISGKLKLWRSYFDLESGVTTSSYSSLDEIAQFIKRNKR